MIRLSLKATGTPGYELVWNILYFLDFLHVDSFLTDGPLANLLSALRQEPPDKATVDAAIATVQLSPTFKGKISIDGTEWVKMEVTPGGEKRPYTFLFCCNPTGPEYMIYLEGSVITNLWQRCALLNMVLQEQQAEGLQAHVTEAGGVTYPEDLEVLLAQTAIGMRVRRLAKAMKPKAKPKT